jgi:hypothetical protein
MEVLGNFSMRWFTTLLLIVEGVFLAVISGLFIVLLIAFMASETHAWYLALLLSCAGFGLSTLCWMFVRYGPLLKTPPARMNVLTWAGWVVGNCLAVVPIAYFFLQNPINGDGIFALALFGPLSAISVHMLVRYRNAREELRSISRSISIKF